MLDPFSGSIQTLNLPLQHNQVIGITIFTEHNYNVIANYNDGIIINKNGENKSDLVNKVCSIGSDKFRRISFFKKYKIQG